MAAQVTAFLGAATALGDYFARFEKQEVAGELQSIRREIEVLTKEAVLKDSLLKDHKELVEVRKAKQMLRSTVSRFAKKLKIVSSPTSLLPFAVCLSLRALTLFKPWSRSWVSGG
jgi:hypothetical protein